MQRNAETEIKLVASPAMMLDLRGHAALSGPEATIRMTNCYFDTASGKLGSAGATLRIRESPGGREQTLKLAAARGSAVQRNEWTVPAPGEWPDPSLFPAPARAALKRMLGSEALGAMAVSRIERVTRQVKFRKSAIEIALDTGSIEASGRKQDVCEVELELVRGNLADVLALAAALPLGPDLSWSVLSKAARCHGLAFEAPALPVRARAPHFAMQADCAAAFQAIAWECLGQLLGNYPLVIADADPGAVHQVRVAIRRLRAACSLFGDQIDDDAGPVLHAELKAVALELGALRDLDVLMKRVARSAKDAGQDVAELKARLETKRAAVAQPVQELLSSASFQQLLFGLASWIEAGAWRVRHRNAAAKRPVRPFAARILNKRISKLRRMKKQLSNMSIGKRHALRIRIKKLYYAAEFFAGLFGERPVPKNRRQFVKALARLQDCLGELNDLAVAEANCKSLFSDVEPIAAAALDVQLEALLKPPGKQVKQLLKAAEKARRKLLDLPPWWKAP